MLTNAFHTATKFETRVREAEHCRLKRVDRVPVIALVQKISDRDVLKFMVDHDVTGAGLQQRVRSHASVKLQPSESLYAFVVIYKNDKITSETLLPPASTFREVDSKYRSDDGFVYIVYAKEDTFG
jgi:GABA(A) receptor-associated protein